MADNAGENFVSFEGDLLSDIKFEEDVAVTEEPPTEAPIDSDIPSDSDVAEVANSTEDVALVKQNERMHLAILDTIADKFDDLEQGKLTKEEMKAWLDKNELYHDKADKSRRLKAQYRTFMDTLEATPPVPSNPATGATGNIDEIVAQAVAKALASQDTQKNEQVFTQSLESFASSKGLKGDTFSTFQKNASALRQVHTEASQDQILVMAYRATIPLKNSGVVLPSQTSGAMPTVSAEAQDITKGIAFINITPSQKLF